LIPVKVQEGRKDPFSDWDPRTAMSADIPALLRQLENNTKLNVGALFFGKYVDIDEDSNVPFIKPALDMFLPRTPWEWGRASKPRSHRVYVLHEDFDRDIHGPILRYMKSLKIGTPTPGWNRDNGDDPNISNYSVEIRGGRPENALFTVMPGSYRADFDEMVEWSQDVDTSVSAAHIATWYLVKRVRMAQATALLANYFSDGVRNDMSLAISGLLWRIRQNSLIANGVLHESDLKEDVFQLTEDDASEIFQNLLKLADTNSKDKRQRQLNFENTWNKLNNDPTAKVTGGKVLAELIGLDGEKVLRALYRLLSDNDGIIELEKLTEQFVIWYKEGKVIDLELVREGHDSPWMTKDQATNSLGGRKITVGNKLVNISTLLFNSTAFRQVRGLTFDPTTQEQIVDWRGKNYVNQFRGWAVEPYSQPVTDEDIKPFLDYVLNVLANGNEIHACWILDWCADMFQQPAFKPGTCLVLIGEQGAGKSFLGEWVLGKIVGDHHYAKTNDIETLTSKFNQLADNKIFFQCDEAVHSYQKGVAAKLKSLITDETIVIEPKGVNAFNKPNHIHYLFTSNDKNNPIFIDPNPNERRFTVLHVSDKYINDLGFWSEIRKWTAAHLPHILRWFLDRKYDKQNIRRPLSTDIKQQIQRMGVDPEVSWMINRVAQGFPLDAKNHVHWWYAYNSAKIDENDKRYDTVRRDSWPDRVCLPVLEADYRDFVRQHGRSVYSGSIGTLIRQVLPEGALEKGGQVSVQYTDSKSGQTVKDRVRVHKFPSKEDIVDFLRKRHGNIVSQLLDQATNDELEEIVIPPTASEEY
jgi:hypothetical protein